MVYLRWCTCYGVPAVVLPAIVYRYGVTCNGVLAMVWSCYGVPAMVYLLGFACYGVPAMVFRYTCYGVPVIRITF